MAHAVFVSYSSRDRDAAELIRHALESNAIPCWIAPRDVLPSVPYSSAIIQGIEGSRLFLLVMSSQSNDSPHVLREVERAGSKRIPLLPFRIENVLPSRDLEYFLGAPHWFDAHTAPLESHLERLVQVVRTILGQPSDPPPQPSVAPPVKVGAVHVAGTAFTLQHFADYADVPFSVTNLSARPHKVARLTLHIDSRVAIEKLRLKKAGAILQEFELRATIGTEDAIDLLAGTRVQVLLDPRGTEAFRLRVEGPEGFLLTCRVAAELFDLEASSAVEVASNPFQMEFPIRSLETLRQRSAR